MSDDQQASSDVDRRAPRLWKSRSFKVVGCAVALVVLGLLIIGLLLAVALLTPQPTLAPVELPLADGRTFVIEAVTYGTNHVVGRDSELLKRVGRWLPSPVHRMLDSGQHRNEVTTPIPSLVIWANAMDTAYGTNVDCQAVRLELADPGGVRFGEPGMSWFGGSRFWRQAFAFQVYPRSQTNLTVHITPWSTNATATATIPNPFPAKAANWVGEPLPQSIRSAEYEVSLDQLVLSTNRLEPKYWETATPYWHPMWRITRDGREARGWQHPVWTAEDASGNRGKYLGTNQAVLRYSVVCYPRTTNELAAELVTRLPNVDLSLLSSNHFWNLTLTSSVGPVRLIGLLPPSVPRAHVFSEGQFLTNPPVKMGAVGGGAPSGWTARSQYTTPIQLKRWSGHYTPVPTFYLHADLSHTNARYAIRLRDEQGGLIPTHMEPQGHPDDVWPYLVRAAGVKRVTPEVVLLRPLEASFDVDMTSLTNSTMQVDHASVAEDDPDETVVDPW